MAVLLYLVVVLVVAGGLLLWLTQRAGSRSEMFALSAASPLPVSDIRRWAVTLLGRDLGYARFVLDTQDAGRIVFKRTYRRPATWVATVLTFPVGLVLFVAFKCVDNVTVIFTPASRGDMVIDVSGIATPRVVEGISHRLEADLQLGARSG